MSIIDKANKYIGHPREVDEGYEVSMRRDAYAQGYQDAIDKATQWLFENIYDYFGMTDQAMVESFRKYLEE